MKKVALIVLVSFLALSGCALHTNTKGSDVGPVSIEAIPLEVGIHVGEKVSGNCEYRALLGFPFRAPEKRAFGVEFDQAHANFGGVCTEGAVYEAITKSNADLLIAPRYFVSGWGICFPFTDVCIWRSVDITVTGFKGTYEKFEKLSPDMRKIKAMGNMKTEQAKEEGPLSSITSFFSH